MDRATIFEEWARTKFGLTASVEPGFDDVLFNDTAMPTTFMFSDIQEDNRNEIKKDGQNSLQVIGEK